MKAVALIVVILVFFLAMVALNAMFGSGSSRPYNPCEAYSENVCR